MWDKSTKVEVSTKETEEAKAKLQQDYEKAHKEAQDELSKKSEALIKANLTLAETNPKSILDMDTKMQNKIIKKVYWYENLEELTLLLWDNFYDDKSDEDKDDDKMSILEKEVKILKYQRDRDWMDRALENFQLKNEKLLKEDDGAFDRLRKEIEYISDKLPANERIERASKIAFGNIISNSDDAYLKMQEISMGWSSKKVTENKEIKNQEVDDIFNSILAGAKQKTEYLKKMR